MKITDMGLVQATMKDLFDLRLEQFFAAVDSGPEDLSPNQRCGTVMTVKGYTE